MEDLTHRECSTLHSRSNIYKGRLSFKEQQSTIVLQTKNLLLQERGANWKIPIKVQIDV
jgi:hypothetical protein